MKKRFYFMSLAYIIMFAACSSDPDPFEAEDTEPLTVEIITIDVGLPENNSTRVHMNELTDMVWSEGDHIEAYGYVGGVCSAPSLFELTSGAGTASGVFSGQYNNEWEKFELSYKGAKVSYSPDIENIYPEYSYLKQTQVGMNDFSHIKDHLLLKSGLFSDAVTSKNIVLKPQCSVLRLDVKNLPDIIKNSDMMTVSFYVDYKSVGLVKNAELQLTGKVVPDADNYIYMAFEPGHDLKAGGRLELKFSANGTVCKASVTSDNGRNYEPGMIYTVTLDYKKPGPWVWEIQ